MFLIRDIVKSVKVSDCPDRESLRAYYEAALREWVKNEESDALVRQIREALDDHCRIHGCDPEWLHRNQEQE
jgi:hypothetical protein